MADVPLTGITGGGGLLATSSVIPSQSIPSGTSTDVTISCPVNKFIRLVNLNSSGGTVGGVSLTFGSRLILDAKTVTTTSLSGYPDSTINVIGKRNEDLIFSFTFATSFSLIYSYEVLEDA